LFFVTFVAFAAAALLIGCQPGEQVSEEAVPEEAMEASIDESLQGIIDGFTAAWNAGDAAGVAAFYTMDGDSSGPDGEMYSGREQIAARYAELLETIYAGTTVSISTTTFRELEPGVVLTNGTWEVSGMTVAEGEDMPPTKGLYSNIVVKEGDEWLITSLRSWFPVKAPGTT
jgi:uncharacterized protein (TIGR02246 family)